MFDSILRCLKRCVQENAYVVSVHAVEEIEDDGLSIFDVESAILNGAIIERQRERSTRDWKYLIRGPALDFSVINVAAKLGPTGRMIVITVFRD